MEPPASLKMMVFLVLLLLVDGGQCHKLAKGAMAKMASMAMAMGLMAVVLLGTAPSLATAASGVATFYTEYTPSACYGNKNMGNMVAAASDSFWNNGAVCGRCYRVKCTGPAYSGSGNPCTGNSVVVKIVDECASSDGCQSTIDLSKQAFAKIAKLDAGEVKVTFNPTGCP